MTYQKETAPRDADTDEVLEVPYKPASPALPVETFPLAGLAERRGVAELTTRQRLQFELLVWCTAGRGRHEVDFEDVELGPGRIVHVRTGQVHRWILDPPYEARLILLRPLDRRSDWRAGPRVITPDRDTGQDLDRVLDIVGRQGRTPLTLASLEAVRDLLVSLLELNRPQADNPTQHESIFRDFERLLFDAAPPPRTVDSCAQRLGCSTRTLTRACRSVAGVTPKVMLDRAVALEAQRQLSLGDTTIAAVAERLGFAELSNFTRFFQRVTGETPSAFVAGATRAPLIGHGRRRADG